MLHAFIEASRISLRASRGELSYRHYGCKLRFCQSFWAFWSVSCGSHPEGLFLLCAEKNGFCLKARLQKPPEPEALCCCRSSDIGACVSFLSLDGSDGGPVSASAPERKLWPLLLMWSFDPTCIVAWQKRKKAAKF